MVKTGIYKITSPSGKIYIGQSIDIEKRWEKNYKTLKCKSQIKLYYSLNKYGWDQHMSEIIEECNSNELLERETYWKNYYKVLEIPSLCCRIDGKGGKLSKETKQKISFSSKGISRNKGIPKSKEHKVKMSEAVRNRIYTSERLENMRLGMVGKNTKKVICITNNIIYNSIREASALLEINERTISNNLLGYTSKTKNNLIFKYINI
jgi:group I intron endonuclease